MESSCRRSRKPCYQAHSFEADWHAGSLVAEVREGLCFFVEFVCFFFPRLFCKERSRRRAKIASEPVGPLSKSRSPVEPETAFSEAP